MTFKDLSFKKKLEHIWEYYKWVILGVMFVIIAGGSMVYAMIKPKPVNYAGIAVYRPHISTEQTDALTADLNNALGLAESDSVTVSNYYFDENDTVFNVEMEQKFVTYLFSMEINVIVAFKADMELFIDSEYIAPLSEYYSDEELKVLEEKGMLFYHTDPLDNQEKPFAIDLSSSALIEKYKVLEGYEEPAYLAIVPIGGYEDNTKSVIDEILK